MIWQLVRAATLSMIVGAAACWGVLSLGDFYVGIGAAGGLVLLAAAPIGLAAFLGWWFSENPRPSGGILTIMVLSSVFGITSCS